MRWGIFGDTGTSAIFMFWKVGRREGHQRCNKNKGKNRRCNVRRRLHSKKREQSSKRKYLFGINHSKRTDCLWQEEEKHDRKDWKRNGLRVEETVAILIRVVGIRHWAPPLTWQPVLSSLYLLLNKRSCEPCSERKIRFNSGYLVPTCGDVADLNTTGQGFNLVQDGHFYSFL